MMNLDLTINTITSRPTDIAGAKRDQALARLALETTFDRIATDAVRDTQSPQQVMLRAALACGFEQVMGVDGLDGDVLVTRRSYSVWGFRICEDGRLWLSDHLGRMD